MVYYRLIIHRKNNAGIGILQAIFEQLSLHNQVVASAKRKGRQAGMSQPNCLSAPEVEATDQHAEQF
jgi:hypothetical protein